MSNAEFELTLRTARESLGEVEQSGQAFLALFDEYIGKFPERQNLHDPCASYFRFLWFPGGGSQYAEYGFRIGSDLQPMPSYPLRLLDGMIIKIKHPYLIAHTGPYSSGEYVSCQSHSFSSIARYYVYDPIVLFEPRLYVYDRFVELGEVLATPSNGSSLWEALARIGRFLTGDVLQFAAGMLNSWVSAITPITIDSPFYIVYFGDATRALIETEGDEFPTWEEWKENHTVPSEALGDLLWEGAEIFGIEDPRGSTAFQNGEKTGDIIGLVVSTVALAYVAPPLAGGGVAAGAVDVVLSGGVIASVEGELVIVAGTWGVIHFSGRLSDDDGDDGDDEDNADGQSSDDNPYYESDWPEGSDEYNLEREVRTAGPSVSLNASPYELEGWELTAITKKTPMVNPDPIEGFIGIRYQATFTTPFGESVNVSANYDPTTGGWGLIKRASIQD